MRKHKRTYQYFTYIVECSDDSFYVGITNNYIKREWEHNEGLDPKCYTYSRRPVKMVYVEEAQYVADAISREKQLKRWSRAKKKALIRDETNLLKKLSERKTPNKPMTAEANRDYKIENKE